MVGGPSARSVAVAEEIKAAPTSSLTGSIIASGDKSRGWAKIVMAGILEGREFQPRGYAAEISLDC
jgi:hypothetical protein